MWTLILLQVLFPFHSPSHPNPTLLTSRTGHLHLHTYTCTPTFCTVDMQAEQIHRDTTDSQRARSFSESNSGALSNTLAAVDIRPLPVITNKNVAIIARCFYNFSSQWTQSTWGLLDGTARQTINYTFKDYPHNSYKIIINNYNYSSIQAKDQKTFIHGIHLLEEFLVNNDVKVVYAHKTIITELLDNLSPIILHSIIFKSTLNLSQGVFISKHCIKSRNHNSINCSLCIYETIRAELNNSLNLNSVPITQAKNSYTNNSYTQANNSYQSD